MMRRAICIFLFLVVPIIFAQQYAVDKGSVIISGSAAYLSQSGDWYENEGGKNMTILTLASAYSYFVSPNIGVGGVIAWSKQSQGDNNRSAISIGPSIGNFFGNSRSTSILFLIASYRFQSIDNVESISGSNIVFGGGIIFILRDHVGLTIEISYQMESWKHEDWDESVNGNTLAIGIGITGLIY